MGGDEEILYRQCSLQTIAIIREALAEQERGQEKIIDVIKQFVEDYNPRPVGQTAPTVTETKLLRVHAKSNVHDFRETIKLRFPDKPEWALPPSKRNMQNQPVERHTNDDEEDGDHANTSIEDRVRLLNVNACANGTYTRSCRGCGMSFCCDCEVAGYRMGRDCLCRCRNLLTEREVMNRELDQIRDSDRYDQVILEESEFESRSSLAKNRQIVNRLKEINHYPDCCLTSDSL